MSRALGIDDYMLALRGKTIAAGQIPVYSAEDLEHELAAERERCAQLCSSQAEVFHLSAEMERRNENHGLAQEYKCKEAAAKRCASEIRNG